VSLNERSRSYVVDSVCHPVFKLRSDRDRCKEMCISAVKSSLPSQNTEIRSNSQSQSQTQQPSESNPNDNFFVFEDVQCITSGVDNAIEVERCLYLDDYSV